MTGVDGNKQGRKERDQHAQEIVLFRATSVVIHQTTNRHAKPRITFPPVSVANNCCTATLTHDVGRRASGGGAASLDQQGLPPEDDPEFG